MKSIFEASLEELENIVEKNSIEGFTLEGLQDRADFENLFTNRLNAKYIASKLIKEKLRTRRGVNEQEYTAAGDYIPREPVELKEQRLALRRFEIEQREKRLEAQTVLQTTLIKKLSDIEDMLGFLLRKLQDIDKKIGM